MGSSQRHKSWWSLVLLGVAVLTVAFSINRNLWIESTPPDATVLIDGRAVGFTPFKTNLSFKNSSSQFQIRVMKAGYEPQEQTVSYRNVEKLSRSEHLLVELKLVENKREIGVNVTANVEGSLITIDGKPAGTAPLTTNLVFKRPNETSAWNTVTIRVEHPPQYKSEEKAVAANEAFEALKAGNPSLKLGFTLEEIRRVIPVEIKAIEGATVSIESQEFGMVPLKTNLVFTRADGSVPWPKLSLKIQKEGFEYRPPGTDIPEPVYLRQISVDEAAQGAISADHFRPVRFVPVPLRTFEIVSERFLVVKTNALSEVSMNDQGKPPTQITTFKPDNALVLSRISTVPEHTEQFVFSAPKREERSAVGQTAQEEEIVGANIWMGSGSAQTRMTDGRQFDIDPFVTADGKWIYFSSDRLKSRNIWRMPASGRGGFTKITGDLSSFDTEPTVSPDGGKLAYTSRLPGSPVNAPSYIWIANADGTLPTQMRAGKSPAWSPEGGKKVAFVSPENKIWVMDADGGNPTQLTLGDSIDCFPVWTPSGKLIVYASNKALNDLKQHNYDIWVMGADGSNQTQLTANGSFDSSPAVSTDGKYVYFFSNRGAQKAGQETLQIFRLEIQPE